MGKLETNDSETGITLFCFTECMFWTHAKRRHTGSAVTQGTDEYNCPVWLSVYHLCVCPSVWQKPCVCVCVCCCLMASALALAVYLSFYLPPLIWQPVGLRASVHLSPCGPLAVPFTPSVRPMSSLPKGPPLLHPGAHGHWKTFSDRWLSSSISSTLPIWIKDQHWEALSEESIFDETDAITHQLRDGWHLDNEFHWY